MQNQIRRQAKMEKRRQAKMEKIKELMERQNMTWREFAATYGIPLQTFSKWMRGERKPPDYVINLLEEAVLHDIWLGEHGRA